jgi:signal transduction histidine kinase
MDKTPLSQHQLDARFPEAVEAATEAIASAVAQERARLARELHDAVSQTLFSATLIADVLPQTWANDPEKGQRLLQDLGQLNRGAMAELRALLLALRPSALTETPLPLLLKQLADMVTGRTGIPVTVTIEGEFQPPPEVHETFYRLAQEACHNIIKHAQASQATISLSQHSFHEKELCLRITDNGRGFEVTAVSAHHLGLTIMRERAAAIGATLTLNSQPGKGTEMLVRWRNK